jgi:hypothetical protein
MRLLIDRKAIGRVALMMGGEAGKT